MKENDENQKIEKFMKENDENQNNKKFMKENEINLRKTDWNSAINKINKNLLKTIWWKQLKLTTRCWKQWIKLFIFFSSFIYRACKSFNLY